MNQTAVFKQPISVQHGGDADVTLPTQLANGWEAISWSVYPIENHPANPIRHLLIELGPLIPVSSTNASRYSLQRISPCKKYECTDARIAAGDTLCASIRRYSRESASCTLCGC